MSQTKDRKKRLVFFTETFTGGGAEKVLLTLLQNFDYSRYDVTVIVLQDLGTYKDKYYALPIKIKKIFSEGFIGKIQYKLFYQWLHPSVACRWLMRGVRADVCIAFAEGICTKIFAYLPEKYKKIAWVHIDLKSYPWTIGNGVYKDLDQEKSAYKKYDKVVGVSKSVTDVMTDYYNLSNCITIYNPVDAKEIFKMAEGEYECSETIDLNIDDFNIVSIGRLLDQKGYDHLIKLFKPIADRNTKVKLYIIGIGGQLDYLVSLRDSLGLRDKVIFTKYIKNPYPLLKACDLFVCSSISEGYNLAIAEALILGVPVVSTDCAGPNELLDHGKYGIICKDYKELQDSIRILTQDREKLLDLKHKAQMRLDFFDVKKTISDIEKIL